MKPQYLSQSQLNEFVANGFIIIRNGFGRDAASKMTDRGFERLGYLRNDPRTWKQDRIHMPTTQTFDMADFAPPVWKAVCDLLGGEDRIRRPYNWGDALIFNLGVGADQPWAPPSDKVGGWHKDGDFFRHFLDSPEQGLLTIVCWTDMLHQGGGTFIAPDSVGVVARFLAEHPEGVIPTDPGWNGLIHQCKEFVELTGSAGDVVLHHPFMLHATSQNVLRVERAITNPPVFLKEPMNFNRDDAGEFSAVELAVLRGLGVERHDFRPTRPRQEIIPDRVRIQQKMLEEERARQKGLAGSSKN